MKFRWKMEDVLAAIVLHVIYFIGTFVAGFFLLLRYSEIESPLIWIALFVLALLVGVFGPSIYTQEVNMGRGVLKHIREKSKRR